MKTVHDSYDFFLSKILKKKSYYIDKIKYLDEIIKKNKNKFFVTLKLQKKISKKKINIYRNNLKFIGKEVTFFGQINQRQSTVNCKIAKLKDLPTIIKITKNELINNRFSKDKKIDKAINRKIKINWVLNYFKKKRGNLTVIKYEKFLPVGFLLVIKKKNKMIIDLIALSKKYRGKNYAEDMIIFAIKKLFKKNCYVQAGTISFNKRAIKFYKKIGLKSIFTKNIYHYHA